MRVRVKSEGVSVHAIAGSHVVLLGFNVTAAARKGLLGFAVHRTDHTENERHWTRGFRIFEANKARQAKGIAVSTQDNPVQSFLWSDYTAKPAHDYTFRVVPVYGAPDALDPGTPLDARVQTEDESSGTHAVYFNRGVAGSQAYVRKFGDRSPDEVGPAAFKWLSRGLLEALLEFIAQAKDDGWGLRAAMYEFKLKEVLDAFKAAVERGADVRIVYDGREKYDKDDKPTGPFEANRAAVKKAGLKSVCDERTENVSYIAHNKFIVLLKNGKPVQVWTGSTNITAGGIFGHSNVGHIVRDPKVAAAYLDYWEQLQADPTARELRTWTEAKTEMPPTKLSKTAIVPVFSPRQTLGALEWYAERMAAAKECACLTLAFTLSKPFAAALTPKSAALNYVLFDTESEAFSDKGRPDRRVAVGSLLKQDQLENWYANLWDLERLSGLNVHVKYLHTKYLIVDPFGADPLLVSGSANFSDASTRNNDENMLVVRGDPRVVDIYLTEFLRIFDHYRARMFGGSRTVEPGHEPAEASNYLAADDSWTAPFFKAGHTKARQRTIFA